MPSRRLSLASCLHYSTAPTHCKRAERKTFARNMLLQRNLRLAEAPRRGSCQSKLRKHFRVELPLSPVQGVLDSVPVLVELCKLLVRKIIRGAAKDFGAEGVERDIEIVHGVHCIRVGGQGQASSPENISIHSSAVMPVMMNSRSESDRSGKTF